MYVCVCLWKYLHPYKLAHLFMEFVYCSSLGLCKFSSALISKFVNVRMYVCVCLCVRWVSTAPTNCFSNEIYMLILRHTYIYIHTYIATCVGLCATLGYNVGS